MALSERDVSLVQAMAEEVKEILAERELKHQQAIDGLQARIKRLESDIEGLLEITE